MGYVDVLHLEKKKKKNSSAINSSAWILNASFV